MIKVRVVPALGLVYSTCIIDKIIFLTNYEVNSHTLTVKPSNTFLSTNQQYNFEV